MINYDLMGQSYVSVSKTFKTLIQINKGYLVILDNYRLDITPTQLQD